MKEDKKAEFIEYWGLAFTGLILSTCFVIALLLILKFVGIPLFKWTFLR